MRTNPVCTMAAAEPVQLNLVIKSQNIDVKMCLFKEKCPLGAVMHAQ